MPLIELIAGNTKLVLECLDTPTAAAIIAELPISSIADTWGDEVYFSTPVSVALEDNARHIIEAGEIAFWTEGNCVAIGFGPTPISDGNEIRLVTRTNIWAQTSDDVRMLKSVKAGDPVHMAILQE